MTYTPKSTKERVTHRYKIVRGHLDKIITMLEEDKYCMDILNQSKAVQKAMQQADALLLEQHLNTCVLDAARKGLADDVLAEIVEVFKK
jgi:DNA-binding FrmR family transcriptional regulator